MRRTVIVAIVAVAGLLASPAQAADPKQEAAALSVVAGAKAKAGQHKLCADMYLQCYKLDPSFLGYLYSAARCAQKAGQLDDAEKHYREFQLRAPAEHPLRARADGHMKEIMARRSKEVSAAEKAKAEAAMAAKSGKSGTGKQGGGAQGGVAKPAPGMSGKQLGGVATGAIGVGLLATGVVMGLGAMADADSLRSDLAKTTGGLITGVSHQDALDRQASVNRKRTLGVAAGGIGLAAVGVGLWLLLSDDAPASKTSLWLRPGGQVGWAVRW